MPGLRALVVRGEVQVPALLEALGRAPALRHLGVHFKAWRPDELGALLERGPLKTLSSLELHDVNRAADFPFDAFLAGQAAWRHLGFVGLPAHAVGNEVRSRFAGFGAITFVGHDRRDALALDFETTGWGYTAR
jgi:hypothetical protein